MDQRFDGRFIPDSPQVTFNRAGKNSQQCCGILREISLDMPVKTSMLYSMTFMIVCVIKTGKHLEKLEPNLTVTAVIHANRSLVLINTSVVWWVYLIQQSKYNSDSKKTNLVRFLQHYWWRGLELIAWFSATFACGNISTKWYYIVSCLFHDTFKSKFTTYTRKAIYMELDK